jgi:hypothetical protein
MSLRVASPIGDQRDRCEVEPVRAHRAALWRALLGGRVLEPQIAAGPAHAVGGVELQVGRGELQRLVRHLAGESPGDAAQDERLAPLGERDVDLRQCQIGHRARQLAVVDVGP